MSAKTNQASILLTLEILPADAKGARRIIVSGAPAHELPEVRAGLFADRHALVDDVYRALLKRGPQTIKHKETKTDKSKPAADDDMTETDDAPGSAEPVTPDNTLENAILEANAPVSHEPADQPTTELPVVENDPTLVMQEMDAELAIAEANNG